MTTEQVDVVYQFDTPGRDMAEGVKVTVLIRSDPRRVPS